MANYRNPTLDTLAILSDAQALLNVNELSSAFDVKAANCFPANAFLNYKLSSLSSGDAIGIQIIQSANANLSAADVLMTLPDVSSDMTGYSQVPLSNVNITKRYFGLNYVLVSGETAVADAFLSE